MITNIHAITQICCTYFVKKNHLEKLFKTTKSTIKNLNSKNSNHHRHPHSKLQ